VEVVTFPGVRERKCRSCPRTIDADGGDAIIVDRGLCQEERDASGEPQDSSSLVFDGMLA